MVEQKSCRFMVYKQDAAVKANLLLPNVMLYYMKKQKERHSLSDINKINTQKTMTRFY